MLDMGAGLFGVSVAAPWWITLVAVAITLFLRGAEPAMRWLDVLDRIRGRPVQSAQAITVSASSVVGAEHEADPEDPS